MTECTKCTYLIRYSNNRITCLMKQELCIIGGETSYPKDCKYFKGDDE
ncbi:MAG: hypothetical protein IKF11_09695 [Methanobrevibacter sp.]|nr:hypothetical protein [Methanobrevibacter sp.]